ncbi:T-cell activation Rho GTPase-activating protein-like [Strigops habroptila]|uniref:T-cell activation Rho GTPase-activating protein-like n=1 Tax=Strigops habroptila TaxID=2489341 RepID=UPI0011CF1AA2|nr:T-cell activation Rho GTPase-activating protein-like [Strigops habroptila]
MLPQPIQPSNSPPLCPHDLLALLNKHGPSTAGIFHRAARERPSRVIRESLNSGVEVQLENHPVLLLAVLLKDLLRKIPSKLLDDHLYKEWMSALQKTSRQERLAALKEVASKLPEANLLLLWHLLSLLSNISRDMAMSKVTSGNLAISLSPDLLSPSPGAAPGHPGTGDGEGTLCSLPSYSLPSPPQLCCSEGPGCLLSSAKPWGSNQEEQPHGCTFLHRSAGRAGKGCLSPYQPPR